MPDFELNYDDYYVAFLDVLGFKELVMSENKKAELDKYFNLVSGNIQSVKDRKKPLKSVLISDSVVLAYPKQSGSIDDLRELCFAVARIQYALAVNGFWLRGGLSSGNLSIEQSKNIVAGPALVKAYQLEKIASYPRVIIDPSLILEFSTTKREFITSLNTHQTPDWGGNLIWHDSEGHILINLDDDVMFIDYFAPLKTKFSVARDDVFWKIQDQIYRKQENYAKYRWLAQYLLLSIDEIQLKSDPTFEKQLTGIF